MPWRDGVCGRLSEPVSLQVRQLNARDAAALEEIRIRLHRPIEFVFAQERRMTELIPDVKMMDDLVAALCGYARYACEKTLLQGYIPIPGGHRAGVCGRMVEESGASIRLSGISSVCIRIAKHIEGASRSIRPYILRGGLVQRVLLLGPPGCGKTTVLRDAAIFLSDECGRHVAVADEREELFAGMQFGDKGRRIDVLSGIGKARAIEMLIRSMAPEIIITDEIGRADDAEAVMEAVRCGTGLLASAHAEELEDLHRRPVLRRILDNRTFDRYILLGRHGVCLKVWDAQGTEI